ncbi:MAG: hypothetical protein ACKO91_05435 [Acidimicrobiales bacterium]
MTRRRVRALAISLAVAAVPVVVVQVAVAGCSSDREGPTGTTAATTLSGSVAPHPLSASAGAITEAVAAVERARGGPQRYTDLNVTPDGVNVFVALGDGTELAYFWSAGRLEPAAAPSPATLPPFELTGVDLAVAPKLIEAVRARFPTGRVEALALLRRSDAGVVWTVGYRSAQGGLLTVLFGPRGGEPLGAIPAG